MDVPSFDTARIVALTGGRAHGRGGAGPITANYQTMARGEWFVALAGDGFDDHVNVPEAARREVAGVIVQRAFPELSVPQVVVPDTWSALRSLASSARDRFAGPVVAVTGSYGKTTTRALTQCALAPLGPVHHTTHNHNSQPGLCLTLLACPRSSVAQVIEIGTSGPGVIAREAALVRPTVRIVTNADAAHLEALGSVDGVAREKAALIATARPGDTVVVDAADPRLAAWPVPEGVRRVTVGAGGLVELVHTEVRDQRLRARFATPSGEVTATLQTTAPFVAANARFALAASLTLGVDPREAADALSAFSAVGRRMNSHPVSGAWLVDDTFNASPASVVAAVRWLATQERPRIAVLGDMAELGEHQARYHDEVLREVLAADLDDVLLVGPCLHEAAAGHGLATTDDLDQAVSWLRERLRPGSTALVKASRAMGLDRVVDACR